VPVDVVDPLLAQIDLIGVADHDPYTRRAGGRRHHHRPGIDGADRDI
jgi:hypothetical protein